MMILRDTTTFHVKNSTANFKIYSFGNEIMHS